MQIAVLGLGYVGSVSAAALVARGHEVVGVDVSPRKVELLAAGRSPVLEPGLAELLAAGAAAGRLRATGDAEEAVAASDISLVCVGTPGRTDGTLFTDALERVAASIGGGLARARPGHVVIVRSTTAPGTCRALLPVLESTSGLVAGADFGLVANPEFMREGTALDDFERPPKIVIGQLDAASGDAAAQLHEGIDARVFRVSLEAAELAKLADNAFHALKVAFANEVGAVGRAHGLDGRDVMRILVSDTKLNLSPAYLEPGLPFGGSCLGKDVRALVETGGAAGVEMPLLRGVLPSNERHLDRVLGLIEATGRRRIGLLGLAFKPGTDDLRESPLVELAARLLERGHEVALFDPLVDPARLVGANRAHLEARLPGFDSMLAGSAEEVVRGVEVCVYGARSAEAVAALAGAHDRVVVDLARLPEGARLDGVYVGLAW